MRTAVASAFVLLFVLSGCVESTWTYTLNPDGTGKVKIDALLQPPFDIFDSRRDRDKDDPDALAKKVAGKILAKSEGVAAWKDVSHGIADDGRVIFKGTAYFGELAKLEVKGDPFPTSFLRPKLSKEGETRLVLGLQFGDIKEESTGEREDESPAEPESEPTVDEMALGVKKGKVAYQTIKPIATAFLSTMKTEIVVRLPGEVVEASNFRKDEDGALRLVFDGPALLGTLDELAEKDAAKWYEFAMKMKEEKRPDEELLWELNKLVFGERGPVRALVAGEVEPLFDYQREVSEAKSDYERLVDEVGVGATVGARRVRSPWEDVWGFSAGILASARTDSGIGLGWTIVIPAGATCGISGGELEVSRVGYEDDDGRYDLMRIAFTATDRSRHQGVGGGLALSFGEGDIWGLAPQAQYGVGYFGERAEVYVGGSVYLWLGERDDEFDVDVEADIRLVAGVRF